MDENIFELNGFKEYLPLKIDITDKNTLIYNLILAYHFLRIDQVNKEKILIIITSPLVTMDMVTSGRKIRDQGSNFRHETRKSETAAVLCYYIKKYFLFIHLIV